ncbi:MAG TPA: TolC family protein [Myxococcales bacterium]|nr:TolC family protein [Myxococcales bacterium]
MGSALALALVLASPAELVPGPPAPAPPADRVTLREAVARALARNPTATVARAELRRAGDLVEQARSYALPNALVQGQYVYYSTASASTPGSTNPTGTGANSGDVLYAPNSFYGWLQVGVPLVAPPAWVGWAHARDNAKVAEWTEKETRRELALGVAHAYLAVIAQKRVVEAGERATQTDRAHYEYTKQRLGGGLGTPLDQMRARQQYQSDRASYEQSLLGLTQAQEALGVLLGEDHAVDVSEEPSFGPAPDPAAALDEARKARPDLLGLESRKAAARHVVRDAWADYAPTLGLFAAPFYQAPPYPGLSPLSWELVLTLTFTIYDGGLRYGQEKEREELSIEADAALEGALRQAGADVRVGYEAVARSDAALRAAADAAAAAHQALDVANLMFKAGATTNIDVVDAERRARDADTAAAIAEDAVRQARLDLLAAVGRFPPT